MDEGLKKQWCHYCEKDSFGTTFDKCLELDQNVNVINFKQITNNI